jgi:hypothetical protein
MAELQGYAAKAGYKKAVTWGLAVALSPTTGDQFEYATEDVIPNVELIESDQITGDALAGASSVGQVTVEGSVSGIDLRFQGNERWIRDVFGTFVTTNPGITHFQHKADFALSNQGKFGTLVIDKQVSVHEYDSFKPMGLTITGAPGAFTKLDVRGIGRRVFIEDPGRTNDTFTSVLPSYARILARFGMTTIKIDDAPTNPPITPYCASGFTIDFQRQGDPAVTTCDGDYSSEPATDTVEITGVLEFPIYNTDNQELVREYLSKDSQTILFTIDSGIVIPGSTPTKNYMIVIWIPAAQFTDPGWPAVSTRGRVPLTMNWRAHSAATAVDTDAVMPRIYIHNEVADIDDYVTP